MGTTTTRKPIDPTNRDQEFEPTLCRADYWTHCVFCNRRLDEGEVYVALTPEALPVHFREGRPSHVPTRCICVECHDEDFLGDVDDGFA